MPRVPNLDPQVARDLGLRLRRAREDAGLTQEQAAHNAGISRNHLQVIEQGLSDRASRAPFNPHLSVLLNLCEALEVELARVVIDVWGPVPGIVVEYQPEDVHGARSAGPRDRAVGRVTSEGSAASR